MLFLDKPKSKDKKMPQKEASNNVQEKSMSNAAQT
jgi:hypothetical protein